MICLTGDVHHTSMQTEDQKKLGVSEAEAALEYIRITQSFRLKTTLFVTGKAVEEEPVSLSRIYSCGGMESRSYPMMSARTSRLPSFCRAACSHSPSTSGRITIISTTNRSRISWNPGAAFPHIRRSWPSGER